MAMLLLVPSAGIGVVTAKQRCSLSVAVGIGAIAGTPCCCWLDRWHRRHCRRRHCRSPYWRRCSDAVLLLVSPLALALLPVAVLKLVNPLALAPLPTAVFAPKIPLASAFSPQAVLAAWAPSAPVSPPAPAFSQMTAQAWVGTAKDSASPAITTIRKRHAERGNPSKLVIFTPVTSRRPAKTGGRHRLSLRGSHVRRVTRDGGTLPVSEQPERCNSDCRVGRATGTGAFCSKCEHRQSRAVSFPPTSRRARRGGRRPGSR